MLDQDKTKEQLITELHNLEKLVEARTAELTVLSNQLQHEIDQHKATQEALHTCESNFRSQVDFSPDGIGIQQNGKVVFVNASGANMLGAHLPDQIIGKSLMDFVHPDFRDKVQARIQKIINDKTNMPFIEEQLVRLDGRAIDVETGSAPCIFNNVPAAQVVFRDITKRKAFEDAISASEEKFRSVFESANDAMLTSDQHGIITSWNNAASRIYGYTAEEIVGQPVSKIIPKRFIDSHKKHAQEVVSSSLLPIPNQIADLTGLKKDGTEFPAELSMSVWKSSAGTNVTAIIRDITERKRAEINLRESEERFRNLAESATDAIVLVNDAAEIIYWNEGSARTFGYSKDEAIGMPLKTIVGAFDSHSRAFNRFTDLNRSLFSNKVFESQGIKNNGQLFPIEISVSFWKTQEGGLFSAIIRDITDRKQAEEELRRNEEQYRSVVETASDAIITTDVHGIIVNWNSGAEQIYGYSADEIIGKSFVILVPGHVALGSKKKILDFYAQHKMGIVYQNAVLPGKHKDGREFHAEGSVSKWEIADKIYLTAIIRDITERKQAEQALIESENKFRIMAEAIPAAIFIYQGTKLVYINPAAQIFSGFSFEELQKMNFWDIVHPEFRKQTREWGLKRQIGERLPSSYELKIMNKKGASKWVYFSSAIIEYQGRPAVLGSAIDITDRKLADEERKKVLSELKRKQKQLSKSEKLLKQFSAKVLSIREEEKKNISSALHDEIGSMVVALSAQLTLAKDELIENNIDHALNNIVQTETRLKQSVNKIKNIALNLRPPDLDIVGLSTALKNYLLSLSDSTKIVIDFTSTVKDRSIPEKIAIVLYRVSQEAVNNAISHAKAHKVAVQLTFGNGHIYLTIRDDGCGFDTKKQPVFSRKSNKIGIIGMRERIESLGGTFTIESEIKKGTALFISVPYK